jgi:hypothetical protein
LDGVKPDDRQGVREIISVLHSIQSPSPICKNWTVTPTANSHYDVVAHLNNNDCEIFLEDLDLIRQLDNARIVSVSIKFTPTPHVRVRLASKDVRVCVTECDVLRIRKRRTWWPFDRK